MNHSSFGSFFLLNKRQPKCIGPRTSEGEKSAFCTGWLIQSEGCYWAINWHFRCCCRCLLSLKNRQTFFHPACRMAELEVHHHQKCITKITSLQTRIEKIMVTLCMIFEGQNVVFWIKGSMTGIYSASSVSRHQATKFGLDLNKTQKNLFMLILGISAFCDLSCRN